MEETDTNHKMKLTKMHFFGDTEVQRVDLEVSGKTKKECESSFKKLMKYCKEVKIN